VKNVLKQLKQEYVKFVGEKPIGEFNSKGKGYRDSTCTLCRWFERNNKYIFKDGWSLDEYYFTLLFINCTILLTSRESGLILSLIILMKILAIKFLWKMISVYML